MSEAWNWEATMGRNVSVMIVEQDRDLRNLLMGAFEERGYRTWTCLGSETATLILSAVRPEVVLLDMDMLGEATLGLVDDWRRLYPETRVIIESSEVHEPRMRALMEHGAAAFVLKPLALSPLFQLVEHPSEARRPAA